MSKIYLAGKANGRKWDLIDDLDKGKNIFVASDSTKHSEHGWGISPQYGTVRYDVQHDCLDELLNCDYMIAYIDQPGQYGTVAEIGYYSAIMMERPCYLIIQEVAPEDPDEEYDYDASIRNSCWFISNFRTVIPMVTDSFEQSKSLFRKIMLMESPIEYQFWNAFASLGPFHHNYLQPQFSIGKYRADFLFNDAKIIAELDGHDYHSSKEQRTYDAQRDRFIAESGYQVIRFTGSEVFKDAERCAAQLHKLGLTAILGKRAERVFGSES